MPYKNKYLFVPKTDDAFSKLVTKLRNEKGYKYIETTKDCLQHVGDGDALYIYGHGNLGKGIGPTKAEAIPADLLANLLKEAYGLKNLKVTIKLLACNSGVQMPSYAESYALSFAKAMVVLEYTQPVIHGYAGFVVAPGAGHKTSFLELIPGEEEEGTNPIFGVQGRIKPPDGNTDNMRRVTISLTDGQVNLVSGGEWVGIINKTRYPSGDAVYVIGKK